MKPGAVQSLSVRLASLADCAARLDAVAINTSKLGTCRSDLRSFSLQLRCSDNTLFSLVTATREDAKVSPNLADRRLDKPPK